MSAEAEVLTLMLPMRQIAHAQVLTEAANRLRAERGKPPIDTETLMVEALKLGLSVMHQCQVEEFRALGQGGA